MQERRRRPHINTIYSCLATRLAILPYPYSLPHTMKIHNVYHVSLLDKYRPPTAGQTPPEPDLVIADDAAAEQE